MDEVSVLSKANFVGLRTNNAPEYVIFKQKFTTFLGGSSQTPFLMGGFEWSDLLPFLSLRSPISPIHGSTSLGLFYTYDCTHKRFWCRTTTEYCPSCSARILRYPSQGSNLRYTHWSIANLVQMINYLQFGILKWSHPSLCCQYYPQRRNRF